MDIVYGLFASGSLLVLIVASIGFVLAAGITMYLGFQFIAALFTPLPPEDEDDGAVPTDGGRAG